MENINFSSLKRKNIRKIIKDTDALSIEIYNPTPQQQEEIIKILTDNYNNEKKEIDMTEAEILKSLIPMLTNIVLDTNDKMMSEIIEDPSENLLEVQEELSDIVRNIIKRFMKVISKLNDIPQEELNNIIDDEQKENRKKQQG